MISRLQSDWGIVILQDGPSHQVKPSNQSTDATEVTSQVKQKILLSLLHSKVSMSIKYREELLSLAKKAQAVMECSVGAWNLSNNYKECDDDPLWWVKSFQVGEHLVFRRLAIKSSVISNICSGKLEVLWKLSVHQATTIECNNDPLNKSTHYK